MNITNFCGIGKLSNSLQRYGAAPPIAHSKGAEIAMSQLAGNELQAGLAKKLQHSPQISKPPKSLTVPDVTKGKKLDLTLSNRKPYDAAPRNKKGAPFEEALKAAKKPFDIKG